MFKQMKFAARVLVGSVLCVGAANATLIDRGGGLIYDDVLDITWMQNANMPGGVLQHGQAREFASSLEYYDSVRGVVWDDWRLPKMFGSDVGLTGWENSNSELSFMYYNNLGYEPGYSLDRWAVPEPTSDVYNPFIDIQYRNIWLDNTTSWVDTRAWAVHFHFGWTNWTDTGDNGFVWVVRDGDVGAATSSVPEPGTLALLGLGLALVGVTRRRVVKRQ
jgi:hypothetical protein